MESVTSHDLYPPPLACHKLSHFLRPPPPSGACHTLWTAPTQEMANSVAVSLVTSRLDYANSLLFGISQVNLNKLQRIQNTLAKLHSRSQPHLLTRRTLYLALAPCQATHQLQNRHTYIQASAAQLSCLLGKPDPAVCALSCIALTRTAPLGTAACQN